MKLQGNSRVVTSNQPGPHEKIPELVRRHLSHHSQKPVSPHTQAAFDKTVEWLGDRFSNSPLIFDSCCGVGESTQRIANLYPNSRVIGLDKSKVRTDKQDRVLNLPDNAIILRADVIDFWRLAANAKWQLQAHFLLFPNPYPKSAHVQRRWHATPSFADILRLGGQLEVRSNWQIYIEEFAIALEVAGQTSQIQTLEISEPFTAFERKYHASEQKIWQLKSTLN